MTRSAAVVALAVIALMVAALSASAEPSLWGFSGLLQTPTSQVLGEDDYNFGINSTEAEDLDDFAYYVNFGLDNDMEVGALLWRPDDPSMGSASMRPSSDETFLSLKKIITPSDVNPTISVGVFDLTDEVETTVYGVATWRQGRVVGQLEGRDVNFLNLHAGFAAGQFQDFFAAGEVAFGPYVGIMAEWLNDDINFGARFRPSTDVNLDLGLLDGDDFAVNVSYNKEL